MQVRKQAGLVRDSLPISEGDIFSPILYVIKTSGKLVGAKLNDMRADTLIIVDDHAARSWQVVAFNRDVVVGVAGMHFAERKLRHRTSNAILAGCLASRP